MKKLSIRFSKVAGGYSLSYGGKPAKRSRPEVLFRRVERKLKPFMKEGIPPKKGQTGVKLVRYKEVVIDVRVFDGQLDKWGTYTDPYEALYVLLCFIEDYVPKEFLKNKSKEYVAFMKGRPGSLIPAMDGLPA